MPELADRREVADEGEAGPHAPAPIQSRCLNHFLTSFSSDIGAPSSRMRGAAVAFDLALDPQEDLGVDGLRAGKAAPQAPGHGGEQEQRQRADHQQAGEVDEVLRVQHQPEDVEAARAQVEQHGLALAPLQPGQPVEHELRQRTRRPSASARRCPTPSADRSSSALRTASPPRRCAGTGTMGMTLRVAEDCTRRLRQGLGGCRLVGQAPDIGAQHLDLRLGQLAGLRRHVAGLAAVDRWR